MRSQTPVGTNRYRRHRFGRERPHRPGPLRRRGSRATADKPVVTRRARTTHPKGALHSRSAAARSRSPAPRSRCTATRRYHRNARSPRTGAPRRPANRCSLKHPLARARSTSGSALPLSARRRDRRARLVLHRRQARGARASVAQERRRWRRQCAAGFRAPPRSGPRWPIIRPLRRMVPLDVAARATTSTPPAASMRHLGVTPRCPLKNARTPRPSERGFTSAACATPRSSSAALDTPRATGQLIGPSYSFCSRNPSMKLGLPLPIM